jgi:hypothetical protein
MKKNDNVCQILISCLFFILVSNCTFAQSTTTVNEQALDSLEKSTLVKLHIDDENEDELSNKKGKGVLTKVFRQATTFKFDAYFDNRYNKKITVRLMDENRKVVFEDVAIKRPKYQRVYDFSYLDNPERYQLVVIYDDREHPVQPIRLESIEAIEDYAKFSVEYANFKDISARK